MCRCRFIDLCKLYDISQPGIAQCDCLKWCYAEIGTLRDDRKHHDATWTDLLNSSVEGHGFGYTVGG